MKSLIWMSIKFGGFPDQVVPEEMVDGLSSREVAAFDVFIVLVPLELPIILAPRKVTVKLAWPGPLTNI